MIADSCYFVVVRHGGGGGGVCMCVRARGRVRAQAPTCRYGV